MTVLLKEAIKPNLVQTLEGQPVLMHCGPFANIAHGNNSLIADLIGMKIGDYVVTESGFGSDMGMEKFFDIVCRFGKLTPSATVLVTTVRAIKHHSGIDDDPRIDRSGSLNAIEVGFANVKRHLKTIKAFGVPAVVTPFISFTRTTSRPGQDRGGGQAGLRRPRHLPLSRGRGEDRPVHPRGLGHFPICMAKTHLSLSADPTLLNAPENFSLPVRDIRPTPGRAGWCRSAATCSRCRAWASRRRP